MPLRRPNEPNIGNDIKTWPYFFLSAWREIGGAVRWGVRKSSSFVRHSNFFCNSLPRNVLFLFLVHRGLRTFRSASSHTALLFLVPPLYRLPERIFLPRIPLLLAFPSLRLGWSFFFIQEQLVRPVCLRSELPCYKTVAHFNPPAQFARRR